MEPNIKIEDVKSKLDKYIIGQEEQKIQIISTIASHFEKVYLKEKGVIENFNKTAAICIGPSGSGKTYTVETCCKLMGLDFISYDVQNMTAPGWSGDNFSDIIQLLFEQCNYDTYRTEHAIVFLDEFDKKAPAYTSQRSYSIKDQAALLRSIMSDKVEVKKKGSSWVKINTENILFIFAGAFADLTMKSSGKKIGLNVPIKNDLKKITKQDLLDYGIMPELLGRIGQLIVFESLSNEQLKNVILHAKGSVVKDWQQFLKTKNIDLTIEEEAIDYFIEHAQSESFGVRGINSEIDSYLNKQYFDIIKNDYQGDLIIYLTHAKQIDVIKNEVNPDYSKIFQDRYYLKFDFLVNGNLNRNIKYFINDVIDYSFACIQYKSKQEIKAVESFFRTGLLFMMKHLCKGDQVLKSINFFIDLEKKRDEGVSLIDFIKEVDDEKQQMSLKDSFSIYLSYIEEHQLNLTRFKPIVQDCVIDAQRKEREINELRTN